MLFNSYEFIAVFLPITVLMFFILGKYLPRKYAIFWLVITSLFFYGWWNPKYLILLCVSIIANYTIGILIKNYNNTKEYKKSVIYLYLGVIFNLLLLAYYKYSSFFLDTLNDISGLDWNLGNILLPIGISFFTFQQIAYLVDTRTNKTSEHGFLHYTLFVIFFPQLIAGPIVHHKQMLPQFINKQTFRPHISNISVGLSIFVLGLFKKVILADNLALYASPVFEIAESGETINFIQAWTATLSYSLQLYFDFSGYSDMAIGLARLFGIKLPLNFYSPYKATCIIDFWKRWHMTLSKFLRDYVYIPLGGNRKGWRRRYINLILTMLIGGLWHGAAWTFVVWGAVHGFYIIINHLWKKLCIKSMNKWWSVLMSRAFTFFMVSIAWVLFRAETFGGAVEIYRGMFNLPYLLSERISGIGLVLPYIGFSFSDYNVSYFDINLLLLLMLAVLLLFFLPNSLQLMSKFQPAYDYAEKFKYFNKVLSSNKKCMQWKPGLVWSLFISILFILSIMNLTQVSEFLYFQF